MDKEVLFIFSAVFVVALTTLVIDWSSSDAGVVFEDGPAGLEGVEYSDASSGFDAVTGDASWKKMRKKIKAEARRVEQRVQAEAQRFEKRVEAEGKRFGKRTSAEWQRFDERVGNELGRFGERVENEFNRIDDNIKKLGDKAEEEYKRVLRRVREEVDTQKDVIKSLSKGRICDAYNAAQKSDLYDAKQFIYDQLLPVVKPVLRPHVATIVAQIAAPINAIPVLGQAIYAVVVPAATEWGTEYAAKKTIREALEECG